MDIPADTTKNNEPEVQKISVTVGTTSVRQESVPLEPGIKQADAAPASEDRNKIIAELIGSKKYALMIKEKRTTPLLTFGFVKTRDKKSHRAPRHQQKNQAKKSTTKKVESRRAKTIKLSIIGLLWIAGYLAIDSGVIDVGWQPPLRIIGRDDASASEVLQVPTEAAR